MFNLKGGKLDSRFFQVIIKGNEDPSVPLDLPGRDLSDLPLIVKIVFIDSHELAHRFGKRRWDPFLSEKVARKTSYARSIDDAFCCLKIFESFQSKDVLPGEFPFLDKPEELVQHLLLTPLGFPAISFPGHPLEIILNRLPEVFNCRGWLIHPGDSL
jgi:hypothetical protein